MAERCLTGPARRIDIERRVITEMFPATTYDKIKRIIEVALLVDGEQFCIRFRLPEGFPFVGAEIYIRKATDVEWKHVKEFLLERRPKEQWDSFVKEEYNPVVEWTAGGKTLLSILLGLLPLLV